MQDLYNRKRRIERLIFFSFLFILSNNKTVEKIQFRVGIEPNNQRLTNRANTQTTEVSRHTFDMYYSTVVSWLCYSMIILLFDRMKRKEKNISLSILPFLLLCKMFYKKFFLVKVKKKQMCFFFVLSTKENNLCHKKILSYLFLRLCCEAKRKAKKKNLSISVIYSIINR